MANTEDLKSSGRQRPCEFEYFALGISTSYANRRSSCLVRWFLDRCSLDDDKEL